MAIFPLYFPLFYKPCVATHIQGKIYYLKLSLDTKLPLTLKKEVLEILDKTPHGKTHWINEKGGSFDEETYLISSIKIGNRLLKEVEVCEEQESRLIQKAFGIIGRPLLEQQNLFFDFPHGALFIEESLRFLQKRGFCPKKLVKIPFTKNKGGLVVEVETDLGTRRLSLSISNSHTFIRPSLAKNFTCEVESENLPFLPSSRLVLGGEDFGKKSLYLVDFTEKITEIDGCIGMDFLKQHVLYLDFKNNLAYIDKKK